MSKEFNFRMNENGKVEEVEDKEERRKEEVEENQYEGEKVEGLAEGQGKQILVGEGITYSGTFKGGKKHGAGYLVNGNLDTLEC